MNRRIDECVSVEIHLNLWAPNRSVDLIPFPLSDVIRGRGRSGSENLSSLEGKRGMIIWTKSNPHAMFAHLYEDKMRRWMNVDE